VLLKNDPMETAFEIVAVREEQFEDGIYQLRLVHACAVKEPEGGEKRLDLDLSWVRCPWCSKRVPERIRRIFRQ
jgi:hypothetical protein